MRYSASTATEGALHIRPTVPTNEPCQKNLRLPEPIRDDQRPSQISARAVGLTMDARNNVPGRDTPQTRQRFAPALTSAPQRLQGKGKLSPGHSRNSYC
jgi:hypothetical protein